MVGMFIIIILGINGVLLNVKHYIFQTLNHNVTCGVQTVSHQGQSSLQADCGTRSRETCVQKTAARPGTPAGAHAHKSRSPVNRTKITLLHKPGRRPAEKAINATNCPQQNFLPIQLIVWLTVPQLPPVCLFV